MSGLAQKVLASSATMMLIRFVQRGIGLVSTLILARLLTPADFGLVAIIAVVIQFFEVVSTTGSEKYIIQKSDLDDEDLSTAWTINLLFKTGLWFLLILAAPIIADFYDKPELTFALWVISFSLIINGFLSPGLMVLKKNLQYRKILYLSVCQKLFSFLVVMLVILIEPSYWALILGDLASALAYVIGSFLIHPFRPRLSLGHVKRQVVFSQWIFYKSLFGFARAQVDTILISRNFGLADVGMFHVIKGLTAMPATDIISPAVDPLLSAFSMVKHDAEDLAYKIRFSLCCMLFMIFPLCAYIAAFPHHIIDVFLGSQWVAGYSILSIMSLMLLTISISHLFESVCIALSKVKQLFYYNVISTLVVFACLLTLSADDLDWFVLVRVILGLASALCFLFYISRLIRIRMGRLLLLSTPMIACAAMAIWITQWVDQTLEMHSFVMLCLTTAVMFGTYFVLMLVVYASGFHRFDEYHSVKAIILRLLRRTP